MTSLPTYLPTWCWRAPVRLAMMAALRARVALAFVNPALRHRVMRFCSLQARANASCTGGRTRERRCSSPAKDGLFAPREGPAPPPRKVRAPAQRLIGRSLSFLCLAQPGRRLRRSRCHRAGSGASENCRIIGALPVNFGEHSNCEGRGRCFPTSLLAGLFHSQEGSICPSAQ